MTKKTTVFPMMVTLQVAAADSKSGTTIELTLFFLRRFTLCI